MNHGESARIFPVPIPARPASPLAARHTDRDLFIFHAAFLGFSAAVMALPIALPAGQRLLILLGTYHVAFPLVGWRLGHREWIRLWSFLAPLSALLFYPQLMLSVEYASVVFNATGAPEIARVPLYAGLLWTIPLLIVVHGGRRLTRFLTAPWAVLVVTGLASATVFSAEMLNARVDLWYAQHVLTLAGVAVYTIAPNILLGVGAWAVYRATRNRHAALRVGAAFLTMLTYQGGLTAGYFLFERILIL